MRDRPEDPLRVWVGNVIAGVSRPLLLSELEQLGCGRSEGLVEAAVFHRSLTAAQQLKGKTNDSQAILTFSHQGFAAAAISKINGSYHCIETLSR